MPSPPDDPLLQSPALARLVGGVPVSLDLLAGGRNSRVYRVAGPSGEPFALKAYFRHPGDTRDRLGTEMAALGFLRDRGVTCVPAPKAKDAEAGLGLYEFIEGERIPEPGPRDVDEAARFLTRLHGFRAHPAAIGLPEASEARFSLRAVAENVEDRLRTLEEGAPALRGFLREELVPAWQDLLAECRRACQRLGVPFDQDLAAGERTLSPSDFGFHNALRRHGELVFLDFEYFGWDDPAKMVADLLLHPGMDLAMPLRLRLAEGVLEGFSDHPGLKERVRLAYPLFGMKWCTILLNEFLPGPLGRRRFATPAEGTVQDRQAQQMTKTRNQLQRIREAHDPFARAH